jgi:hypothetical protein
MNLGDQGAGRVYNRKAAFGRRLLNRLGHAMGAEDCDAARRHLVQFVDEMGPLGPQAFDDMPVMNDFMPDIDRRAEFIDRPLDDLDRAFDSGAKTTRLGENYLHE